MMRRLPAALAALLLLATPALAHKVNVFAVAENGMIAGEGYFSGGAKAQNSTVEIVDAQGRLIAQGMTGPDGAFRIPLPMGAGAPLTVVLKAGDGHQNDFTLTAQDLDQSAQAKTLPPPTPGALPIPGVTQAPAPTPPPVDESRLAALVEAATAKAVEEKLTPLKLELARLAAQGQSTRVQDIVGGIGWIVGLVGIAAWFKRPKK
jgi:nickel transport protein